MKTRIKKGTVQRAIHCLHNAGVAPTLEEVLKALGIEGEISHKQTQLVEKTITKQLRRIEWLEFLESEGEYLEEDHFGDDEDDYDDEDGDDEFQAWEDADDEFFINFTDTRYFG